MITKQLMVIIQDKLLESLKECAKEYDLIVRGCSGKFDEETFSFSITGQTTNADKVLLNNYAYANYGIDNAYGQQVNVQGEIFTLIGFEKSARKYKIVGINSKNEKKCFVPQVLYQLDKRVSIEVPLDK